MSAPRKQRARKIQDAIRQVLWRDWNPIGVNSPVPADEYDSYIAPIYRLLISKAKKEAVAAELRRLEEGPIGIGHAQKEALLSIAEKLMAIDVTLDP